MTDNKYFDLPRMMHKQGLFHGLDQNNRNNQPNPRIVLRYQTGDDDQIIKDRLTEEREHHNRGWTKATYNDRNAEAQQKSDSGYLVSSCGNNKSGTSTTRRGGSPTLTIYTL